MPSRAPLIAPTTSSTHARNSASGRSANSVWRSRARSGASIWSSRPRSTIARYSVRSAAATALHVLLARRVVPVLHRRGDDARRRRGHERLARTARRSTSAHSASTSRGVAVGHRADRRRRRHQVDLHPLPAGAGELEEVGVLEQVAHQRPLARAAEPGHPVLHVGEEALAGLLAVVADVDAGVDLRRDHRRGRGLDRPPELGVVDLLAPAAPTVQLGQRLGSREAPGVGGEEPRLAEQHGIAPASCRRRRPGSAPVTWRLRTKPSTASAQSSGVAERCSGVTWRRARGRPSSRPSTASRPGRGRRR